jgi:two-component system response regulator AtoC
LSSNFGRQVMSRGRILIAEDERTARTSLAGLLQTEGFEVLAAEDGVQALSLVLSERPEVVLLDVRMPKLDGLEVLQKLRHEGSDSAVIVMTAYEDSRTVIEAMKFGAFDYVSKPLDSRQLLAQIGRAIQHQKLARDLKAEEQPVETTGRFEGLIGHSPGMQRVYKLIGQVAPADSTVLVRGESGTGKELVVNALHHYSPRSEKPLIKVNCASIPESLLESELFGHEKGAFTHALYRRIGRFEEASGGTLFLDEIGDLAPSLQAKLLRALQERTIERLGSNAPIHVDIRLVAATSRDLERAVAESAFREDLYYRLNVLTIFIPPLRERKQDVPALVQHFVRRAPNPVSITPEALALLSGYEWPGNVRQLENAVERAIVLARNGVITEEQIDLSPNPYAIRQDWREQMPLHDGYKSVIAQVEKALVERALREAQENKTRAAEILGIQRRLLYEKIREHGIETSAGPESRSES